MRTPQTLLRTAAVLATAVGFAASASTAVAAPGDTGQRSDNAPGGAVTKVDENRPAGAGHGRKIG